MEADAENLITLAHGIATDSQLLVEQQLAIFKAEISEEWKGTKRALPLLFLAGVATVVVSLLASSALAHWLVLYKDFSLWSAYSAVSLIGLAIGILCLSVGMFRLRAVSLLPKETLSSLKENLKCLIH